MRISHMNAKLFCEKIDRSGEIYIQWARAGPPHMNKPLALQALTLFSAAVGGGLLGPDVQTYSCPSKTTQPSTFKFCDF